jgi:hypothetical protein
MRRRDKHYYGGPKPKRRMDWPLVLLVAAAVLSLCLMVVATVGMA